MVDKAIPLFMHLPYIRITDWAEDGIPEGFHGYELYLDGKTVREHKFEEPLLPEGKRTLHAPFLDISLGAWDPDYKLLVDKTLVQSMKIAQEINASALIVHSGLNPYTAFTSRLFNDWGNRAGETLAQAAEDAGIKTVNIFLENVFERNAEEFFGIADIISRNIEIGICFDTGHFNYMAEDDLALWVCELKRFKTQLHIHDNDSHGDMHLPPGKGNFPFLRFFDILDLGIAERAVIEMHKKKHFQTALEVLSRIWS